MITILHKHPAEVLDCSTWPSVCEQNLDESDQAIYRRRKTAVDTLIRTERMSEACRVSGLSPDEIVRLVKRCVTRDKETQRVAGYCALVPYHHLNGYVRKELSSPGTAGLLECLFRNFPSVESSMRKFLFRRTDPTALPTRLYWTVEVGPEFLQACRDAGVSPDGYPFTAIHSGVRALARWFHRIVDEGGAAWAAAVFGEDAGRNYEHGFPDGCGGIDRNFVVVIDEWTIDSASTWRLFDGTIVQLPRCKVFTARLLGLNAILGTWLVLKTEPNADDFAEFIDALLRPHSRMELTIPGLSYPTGACFPSELPDLQWCIPDVVFLDNAKIHHAESILRALVDHIGMVLKFGKPRAPKGRPGVESFHAFLAKSFTRLPTGTGSGPDDPFRRDPEGMAKRLKLDLREVGQLIELLAARFNTEPRLSLQGKTAIEHIRAWLTSRRPLLRRVPVDGRATFDACAHVASVNIRCDLSQGRRPTVTYKYARYVGANLRNAHSKTDRAATLVLERHDASRGVLFLNGREFDRVRAQPPWNVPHTLDERIAIMRLALQKKIQRIREGDDPIRIYRKWLSTNAPKDKRSALAHARVDQVAGTGRGDISPNVDEPARVDADDRQGLQFDQVGW